MCSQLCWGHAIQVDNAAGVLGSRFIRGGSHNLGNLDRQSNKMHTRHTSVVVSVAVRLTQLAERRQLETGLQL